MKRKYFSTALRTILVLSLSGCTVLDPNPEPIISGSTDQGPLEQTGKALYERNCISCHGADGISVVSTVTNLKGWAETPEGTFEKLDTAMSTGPGNMPIFDTLDTEARMKIYEYIKTFD